MFKLPNSSRRHVGTFARSVVMLFLIVVGSGAWSMPGYAAAAMASSQLSTEERDVYDALAAGKKVMQPHTYNIPDKPTVYLTFDDGPSKYTSEVLDILQEEGVKATFFQIGQQVQEYPDITRRVVEEGHALGNHSYNHVYQSLYGSFSEFWRQVQLTDDIFMDTAGIRSGLIRAPGGTATNFDAFYFYYLDQAGFQVFDWNVDSGDSKRANVPAREIVDTIKQGPFQHEVTVLMHDGSGHAQTVKALPDIIKVFKDKGYTFGALSERVKPTQFPITKTKWSRMMPAGKFGELAAETRSYGRARLANAQPAPPPTNDVPLQLRFGRTQSTLAPGGYELKQGSLYVPLRSLAEHLGASVTWDERTHTVKVRTGLRELSYELSTGTLRTLLAGHPENRISFADMRMTDGTVVVPLRMSLTLLGGVVGDYSMVRDDRYVNVRPQFGAYPTFSSYSI